MTITDVKTLAGFRVFLRFSDGTAGEVDLSDYAGRGVFTAWLTEGVFQQAKVGKFGDLTWPGEIDLCPDSLYLKVTGQSAEELFPALREQTSHA